MPQREPSQETGQAPHPPLRRRILLMGVVIGVASMLAGIAVGAATFPRGDELRRASVEEIGLDPDLLEHPLVAPVIDRMSQRIERRIIDEARTSMLLAVLTSAAVAVVGVVVLDQVGRRRS